MHLVLLLLQLYIGDHFHFYWQQLFGVLVSCHQSNHHILDRRQACQGHSVYTTKRCVVTECVRNRPGCIVWITICLCVPLHFRAQLWVIIHIFKQYHRLHIQRFRLQQNVKTGFKWKCLHTAVQKQVNVTSQPLVNN